jgi:hypothetical protein
MGEHLWPVQYQDEVFEGPTTSKTVWRRRSLFTADPAAAGNQRWPAARPHPTTKHTTAHSGSFQGFGGTDLQ